LTGLQGETGTGVESAVLNAVVLLTLTFTMATIYTTPKELLDGKAIRAIGYSSMQDLLNQQENGISSIVPNVDGTLTINYKMVVA
jgi:hypothetical protein